MDKSKKKSGSNGSNVSSKGDATKTEKKSTNGKTSNKEDVKKSEVVSVTNDTLVLVSAENDVNAKPLECWNTTPSEDTDKQSKNHQSRNGTSTKKKEEVKKSQVVSETKDTLVPVKAENNVNAEALECWNTTPSEDTDKQSKNHQSKIGTQIKKKNNEKNKDKPNKPERIRILYEPKYVNIYPHDSTATSSAQYKKDKVNESDDSQNLPPEDIPTTSGLSQNPISPPQESIFVYDNIIFILNLIAILIFYVVIIVGLWTKLVELSSLE